MMGCLESTVLMFFRVGIQDEMLRRDLFLATSLQTRDLD